VRSNTEEQLIRVLFKKMTVIRFGWPLSWTSRSFHEKVNFVLNSVARHENILGSEDIAPQILDLGTKWN